jgi:hypothetical protein
MSVERILVLIAPLGLASNVASFCIIDHWRHWLYLVGSLAWFGSLQIMAIDKANELKRRGR